MELPISLLIKSYIANPYWPEKAKLVDLQKMSGMNRARSEDKKDLALRRFLEKQNLTMEDYTQLQEQANRPWHRDDQGQILIPKHHLASALVQACDSAPAGCRFPRGQLRCLIQVSDFVTDRTKADSVFSRFVLPTDGKGNCLSNQRRLATDEAIENAEATGTISFDPTDVKTKAVLELLAYCGKYVGVGSSRKMGYGRFTVKEE